MAFCFRSLLHVQKLSFRPIPFTLSILRQIQIGNIRQVEVDNDFQASVAKVKTLKQDPGNDNKLKLYALFKQVRSLFLMNSEFLSRFSLILYFVLSGTVICNYYFYVSEGVCHGCVEKCNQPLYPMRTLLCT